MSKSNIEGVFSASTQCPKNYQEWKGEWPRLARKTNLLWPCQSFLVAQEMDSIQGRNVAPQPGRDLRWRQTDGGGSCWQWFTEGFFSLKKHNTQWQFWQWVLLTKRMESQNLLNLYYKIPQDFWHIHSSPLSCHQRNKIFRIWHSMTQSLSER